MKHIAYLLSDERMLLGDGVFQPADVIFQNFALVAAQLPRNRFAALIVAERESGEAKRRHCVLGAALRQVPAPIQRDTTIVISHVAFTTNSSQTTQLHSNSRSVMRAKNEI